LNQVSDAAERVTAQSIRDEPANSFSPNAKSLQSTRDAVLAGELRGTGRNIPDLR
jgi:hypothetical protein